MMQNSIRSKRLLWLVAIISSSALLGLVLTAILQPKATAEAEAFVPPTPIPAEFELDNPLVCVIPDDGTFLPCHANLIADELPLQRLPVSSMASNVPCVDGTAAGYPCHQVDLLSHMPLSHFGHVRASDIWGWTDGVTGQEIVILTLRNHTAFIDASDPLSPTLVGTLAMPSGASQSAWRDVKTYRDTAYIVGDLAEAFGVQVFDLTRLRGVTQTAVFTADHLYTGISSTHNIVINEETGLAALVGISSGVERCGGGMHLLDLSVNRLAPTFAGCVAGDGYVHDAQCVLYHGEDSRYVGREICFNFNEDSITIVDVTDRTNPVQLSRSTYSQTAYTHQGWLTADHDLLLVDDEGDETEFGINTTTHLWDVSSLTDPQQVGTYTATTQAVDHNQYVRLGYSFQANYRAGLRILDTADAYRGDLKEVAYFDIFPEDDAAKFNAMWSSYPYFESGVVAVSGIEQGLFLLRPTDLLTQRVAVHVPPTVTVDLDAVSGDSVSYEAVVRTLGLTERYTVSLISTNPAWTVSAESPLVFTGVPTRPEKIKITVALPAVGDGGTSIQLVLEPEQRPAQRVTVTTDLVARQESLTQLYLPLVTRSIQSTSR